MFRNSQGEEEQGWLDIVKEGVNEKMDKQAELKDGQFGIQGSQRNEWASQVALVAKNLPANQEMQETWTPSLGWEDPGGGKW